MRRNRRIFLVLVLAAKSNGTTKRATIRLPRAESDAVLSGIPCESLPLVRRSCSAALLLDGAEVGASIPLTVLRRRPEEHANASVWRRGRNERRPAAGCCLQHQRQRGDARPVSETNFTVGSAWAEAIFNIDQTATSPRRAYPLCGEVANAWFSGAERRRRPATHRLRPAGDAGNGAGRSG